MHIIGYTAAVLTIAAFLPQTYQAIHTRKTRDLSLITYSILVVTSVLWTIYGVTHHSPEIIVTNSVVGMAASAICVMKIIEG